MSAIVHKMLFLIVIAVFVQCTYNVEEVLPVSANVAEPINPVFFNEEIMPIFNQHCNSHCHSITHTYYPIPPVLSPSVAYDELISGGYVDTANPEQSLLYLKVKGTTVGNRMPPGGKLTDYEIKRILDWIKYRAPNN